MSHLSGDLLVARVDDELAPAARAYADRHLERCAACHASAAALDDTRALFTGALQWLDDDEPAAWGAPVPAGAAVAADDTVVPLRPRARRPLPASALRWAAGIVLCATAAAAAMIAPMLVGRMFTAARPAAVPPVPAADGPARGAVAVEPVDGTVEIALTGAGAGTRVRIGLHDRGDVLVDYQTTLAPKFVARDGHVAIDLGGTSARVHIVVPRDLRTGRILIDGRVAAVLEQGRLVRVRGDPGVTIDSDSAGD